jgi:hypothetical protein
MNPRYAEITEIDDYFYVPNQKDDRYIFLLICSSGSSMIWFRSGVLQMHTAIENILNSLIICQFLGMAPEHRKAKMYTNSRPALHKILLGFKTKSDDGHQLRTELLRPFCHKLFKSPSQRPSAASNSMPPH